MRKVLTLLLIFIITLLALVNTTKPAFAIDCTATYEPTDISQIDSVTVTISNTTKDRGYNVSVNDASGRKVFDSGALLKAITDNDVILIKTPPQNPGKYKITARQGLVANICMEAEIEVKSSACGLNISTIPFTSEAECNVTNCPTDFQCTTKVNYPTGSAPECFCYASKSFSRITPIIPFNPTKCNASDASCNACIGGDPAKPQGIPTAVGCIPTNLAGFVGKIFAIILGLAGGIALLLIIYSGYRMATEGSNPESLQGARETLTSAIVGLLFIIFSFVILEVIGVDILRLPQFGRETFQDSSGKNIPKACLDVNHAINNRNECSDDYVKLACVTLRVDIQTTYNEGKTPDQGKLNTRDRCINEGFLPECSEPTTAVYNVDGCGRNNIRLLCSKLNADIRDAQDGCDRGNTTACQRVASLQTVQGRCQQLGF